MDYKFNRAEKYELLSGYLNLGDKNPDGGEITLNSKYLIRNGRLWIPIMGEIHFTKDNCYLEADIQQISKDWKR